MTQVALKGSIDPTLLVDGLVARGEPDISPEQSQEDPTTKASSPASHRGLRPSVRLIGYLATHGVKAGKDLQMQLSQ